MYLAGEMDVIFENAKELAGLVCQVRISPTHPNINVRYANYSGTNYL